MAKIILTFLLIGETTLTIDNHEVRQCQYRARNSDNGTVMTTYVPTSMKCERSLKF